MRVTITDDPFSQLDAGKGWISRGRWPCRWISCPSAGEPPFVTAYRRVFSLDRDAVIRIHVSADERYELFVDGERTGRGSERGDRLNWFYETYDLSLKAGRHVVVARVWSLGPAGMLPSGPVAAPYAQHSVRPGFILAAEGDFIGLLGTGVAEWESKRLGGYSFTNPFPAWGTGARVDIDGAAFPWGFEMGEGDDWGPVDVLHEGANGAICNETPYVHLMKPATLPEMAGGEITINSYRFVAEAFTKDTRSVPVRESDNVASQLAYYGILGTSGAVTIPAYTSGRAIIDLGDYYCAYPEVTTSGGKGSMIRVLWAESLYEQPEGHSKGHRGRIDGKYFWGVGDTFRPDGGKNRRFDTLWWEAGRYIEVYVQTAAEPLTIEGIRLHETRYPLEMQSEFASSDERLSRITPIMLRGLQMCAHETYMDCPYYEQLQYSGDTRLQVLTTYLLTTDDRLPRKAIRQFAASQLPSGINQSRYPSRVTQVIPPFSIWWIGMVYDYALWRGNKTLVGEMMRGVRSVLDWYRSHLNADGLIENPNGWNFVDWVPRWNGGIPPEGEGVSGLLNWQYALGLSMAAKLEAWAGEAECAELNRRLASELAERMAAAFWDDARGLFADDLGKTSFSEHTQCLAVLSGQLCPDRRDRVAESLVSAADLDRTTIYFTHYLFETYRETGKIDALFDRLRLWYELEELGFKTTVEMPEPSRSDCHGWGAHPLYHYFASILGIRPASMGFEAVTIRPQLGPLSWAKGKLAHPKGPIAVDFSMRDGRLTGVVDLPDGISGVLVDGERRIDLQPGTQSV